MLGTAGHVDHGKTALVQLLTGCNTDTLPEERARGLTIDLGFAPCRLADRRVVGVVDVPGHVDFVRNMVAGAHGIDVVILVIAADDGVMPQTREHLHILTLMGLQRGVVVLTKTDLVDDVRRACVLEDIGRLARGTFLESAPVCPVSNVTGDGYGAFFDTLNALVDACGDRDCRGRFRVWVADPFASRGFGTVVTGIPSSGVVRPGDELALAPGGHQGRVRRLEVYGEDAAEGRAGECVALNLPDLDLAEVRRGAVLGPPEAFVPVTMAEAELRLLDSVAGRIKDNAEVHLHVGTASVLARVALLERGEIAAGEQQMAQLRFAEPLALIPGDRYVVRAGLSGVGQGTLTTLGGGRVLGIGNLRLRRRRPWTLATLGARLVALDDPAAWCANTLKESGRILEAGELAHAGNHLAAEVRALLETLQTQGIAVAAPDGGWVHRDVLEGVKARVVEAVRAYHAANPQRLGIDAGSLLPAASGNPVLLRLALDSMVRCGPLQRRGERLAIAGWKPEVASAEEQVASTVEVALRQAGVTAPTIASLAAELHLPLARIEAAVTLLVERGIAVRLGEDLIVHQTAAGTAQQIALRLFARGPSFSTMDFRDALGVSRKYAVPLLDHLDRIRFTTRNGNIRTPGTGAREAMKTPIEGGSEE